MAYNFINTKNCNSNLHDLIVSDQFHYIWLPVIAIPFQANSACDSETVVWFMEWPFDRVGFYSSNKTKKITYDITKPTANNTKPI